MSSAIQLNFCLSLKNGKVDEDGVKIVHYFIKNHVFSMLCKKYRDFLPTQDENEDEVMKEKILNAAKNGQLSQTIDSLVKNMKTRNIIYPGVFMLTCSGEGFSNYLTELLPCLGFKSFDSFTHKLVKIYYIN